MVSTYLDILGNWTRKPRSSISCSTASALYRAKQYARGIQLYCIPRIEVCIIHIHTELFRYLGYRRFARREISISTYGWQVTIPSFHQNSTISITNFFSPLVFCLPLCSLSLMHLYHLNLTTLQIVSYCFCRTLFANRKSVQGTVTLLENLHLILKKTPREYREKEVLRLLYESFVNSTTQVQVSSAKEFEKQKYGRSYREDGGGKEMCKE